MSFSHIQELVSLAEERHCSMGDLMLEVEMEASGQRADEILERMSRQLDVMEQAVRKGTTESVVSKTGLTGGDGFRMQTYLNEGRTLLPGDALRPLAYALAVSEVNASMGRIVATPTAGAAGILPGVLMYMVDTHGTRRETLVRGLLTAAALGLVVANSASISGAVGGCQAEIGSATAMAAGTLVEMQGGSPRQVAHAVGIALKNSLGLVCDPVGGLVEIPCILRNGLHALTAIAAADMALAGIRSIIPADEVIQVMHHIGQKMPSALRETGLGGLASTPTGQRLREQVFGH
ncbi:MAG: L-serine ammonia-lyase, iron-sulfur-dependent, subunit alpha [Alicyclobacillaceae bacterium]|nr:L-serine ammonia-lyase, iron-sulfur-dependent, subunit alpha [Alicyclobacillaceae bacterium]